MSRAATVVVDTMIAARRELQARMATLRERHQAAGLSPATSASLYFLLWQAARHGTRLALRRSRHDRKPDIEAWLGRCDALHSDALTDFLIDVLSRYDFRAVRRRVPDALVGWLRDGWQLRLCEHVPSALEVLHMQAAGARPVTIILDYPRMLEPVLEKADAFAFFLHDLEHAYLFFHDADQHCSQRQFAMRLARSIAAGRFCDYCGDALFSEKFDYLMSDMNTHVLHSLQYLRAILIEFHLRQDKQPPAASLSVCARSKLQALWTALGEDWELGAPAQQALVALGREGLKPQEAARLATALAA